jgi:hypothetical protein
VRSYRKNGGQWAAQRYLPSCGLVSLSIYPHYRHSTKSRLLGGSFSNAFSTSTVARRQAATSADAINRMARKKAREKAHVKPATSTKVGASGVSQASREKVAAEDIREMEDFLRPKPKLRMVGSPEPKSQPDVTTSDVASQLNEAWKKHHELTRMFYKKVEEEDNIFWIESKKLNKVPASKMAKWHFTPRSHRTGLTRVHGTISHVTAYVEDRKLRKSLTDWDANSCQHLAPYFKEILGIRVDLAKANGFNNYMDYNAQYKMLDRISVENFLNQLKQIFSPRIASYMEELFKMKLQDMDYHLPFETLRNNLKYHNRTILDLQDTHPKYRLDVGEVARYGWLKDKKDGSFNSLNYLEYFPLQSTTRKLLDVISPVFGVKFEELLPDGKEYAMVISDYLSSEQSSSKITNKAEELLVFAVKDTCLGKSGWPMGFLVLDLLQRPGKVQIGQCRKFHNVYTTSLLVSLH